MSRRVSTPVALQFNQLNDFLCPFDSINDSGDGQSEMTATASPVCASLTSSSMHSLAVSSSAMAVVALVHSRGVSKLHGHASMSLMVEKGADTPLRPLLCGGFFVAAETRQRSGVQAGHPQALFMAPPPPPPPPPLTRSTSCASAASISTSTITSPSTSASARSVFLPTGCSGSTNPDDEYVVVSPLIPTRTSASRHLFLPGQREVLAEKPRGPIAPLPILGPGYIHSHSLELGDVLFVQGQNPVATAQSLLQLISSEELDKLGNSASGTVPHWLIHVV
jgi:hypothetical protein